MNAWTTFDARAVAPWQTPLEPVTAPKPDFADDESLKQAFGIELAKGKDFFNAGLEIFNQEMAKALWVSTNWKNDPTVIGARDAYLRSLKKAQKPLDKEELLEEVLGYARTAVEDKDKFAFLKLYSEISGFTGPKVNIDQSTNFNNNDNSVKITLVKGSEQQPAKVIDNAPNMKSKMLNSDLPVKLVSSR